MKSRITAACMYLPMIKTEFTETENMIDINFSEKYLRTKLPSFFSGAGQYEKHRMQ